MGRPLNGQCPQLLERNRFAVDTADFTARRDQQLHRSLLLLAAKDIATRFIDEQPFDLALYTSQLASDSLPQVLVFTQLLGLHVTYDPLGLFDQAIQVIVRTDIEVFEAAKEIDQVHHGRIPEDLLLAIVAVSGSGGSFLPLFAGTIVASLDYASDENRNCIATMFHDSPASK